jgi:hypothetical protein
MKAAANPVPSRAERVAAASIAEYIIQLARGS